VRALHGEKYNSKGDCSKCGHQLTYIEILKGFARDPRDFTTKCPKCGNRFAPKLIRHQKYGDIEVSFYCPEQTLDQLKQIGSVPLYDFQTKYAAVYQSAVIHFGGLQQAFKKIGVTYICMIPNWEKRVRKFLGRMPDSKIAELVGVSASTVRKVRTGFGIKSFLERKNACAT
jgi:hypothetical protein